MIYRPEEAYVSANQLSNDAQTWCNIYSRLNAIITEMDTAFKAETQRAFHAANESNQQNYILMQQLLEEMASAIRTTHDNMVEADYAEAQRIYARFIM